MSTQFRWGKGKCPKCGHRTMVNEVTNPDGSKHTEVSHYTCKKVAGVPLWGFTCFCGCKYSGEDPRNKKQRQKRPEKPTTPTTKYHP
jgi:hypothetical protein